MHFQIQLARALQKSLGEWNGVENMNANQTQARIAKVGEGDFEAEVLKAKLPVLVEFAASWSRPCHVLDSVLNEVATACAAKVKVVRVDADNYPDLSLWFGIQSIPTLLYFLGGRVRARIVGTASKEAILTKLNAVSASSGTEPAKTSHNQPNENFAS